MSLVPFSNRTNPYPRGSSQHISSLCEFVMAIYYPHLALGKAHGVDHLKLGTLPKKSDLTFFIYN